MATRTIREEIYDDSGLIEVKHYEIDEVPIADQIKSKEDELLRVYQEIERLKTFTTLP